VTASALDRRIAAVVDGGNCSGCGMCALLDTGIGMEDADGFSRPVRRGPADAVPDAPRHFDRACPGRRVAAQDPEGATRHPLMGPVVQAFEAWAVDPVIRERGSSGGTLTALAAWLAETGEASSVVGAAADPVAPRRTVSVRITTREEALGSAGSRYAPVSAAADATARDASAAIVGKPCEASALRALQSSEGRADGPLLLSFFCAGTPRQQATDDLVAELGIPHDEPVRDLWYRGRGWPGRFTAERLDGSSVSASYDDSWGAHLGPAVQWRCKICPDGIGESSDVTAGDFWRTDARGYPDFAEGAGVSALIARTRRGQDLVLRAVAAGVIAAVPIDIDDVAAIQPLQRQRRTTLAGRLAGARLAGAAVPRYPGFGLLRLAAGQARETYRTAKGTYRRVRARRSA